MSSLPLVTLGSPPQPPREHRVRPAFRVVILLPPDFHAPSIVRRFRMPNQGPALVAASVAPDGVSTYIEDLESAVYRRAPSISPQILDDDERLMAYLRGQPDEEYDGLAEELLGHIADKECDAVAMSLDRHSQVRAALLLGRTIKRLTGKPILLGGANAISAHEWLAQTGAAGIDLVTRARTPPEIRRAFDVLRDVPPGRWESPVEPLSHDIEIPPDEWPLPDFSIYNLELYRQDPFVAMNDFLKSYDGAGRKQLVLPYHFTYGCQFVCTFCQNGGEQKSKSIARVVREMAALSEKWDCGNFMLFDTQVNVYAAELGRELEAARLGIQWTDSYRVMPNRPGTLEAMARGGCAGVTVGVESASDKVLRKMIKGHLSSHATRTVREAHQHGLMVRVNLLPCFPGETHEDFNLTRDWVAQNAFAIDDLAPSSYYLTADSPVGRDPEKYGIAIRGQRTLEGDYKFRKLMSSLTYDEVGVMSWEEREKTLRTAEHDLREAWIRNRPVRFGYPTAAMMALKRMFPTKDEGHAAMQRWSDHYLPGQPMRAPARSQHAPPLQVSSQPVAPPKPPAVLGKLRELFSDRTEYVLCDASWQGDRLDLEVEGPGLTKQVFYIAPLRPGEHAFAATQNLALSYQGNDVTPAIETATALLVQKLASVTMQQLRNP